MLVVVDRQWRGERAGTTDKLQESTGLLAENAKEISFSFCSALSSLFMNTSSGIIESWEEGI